MRNSLHISPILLGENEQVVFAVMGKALPSLSDAIWFMFFPLMTFFLPLLLIHRLFRPVAYMITTNRILVVEPEGLLDEIALNGIVKMRGTRTSLLIYADKKMLVAGALAGCLAF